MSEMWDKKGKNFKEYIEDQKNKGKTFKAVMRAITSLNTEIMYAGLFLGPFIVLSIVMYFALSPSVFVWAGILVVAALVSSVFASRITSMLKNSQWKYKA